MSSGGAKPYWVDTKSLGSQGGLERRSASPLSAMARGVLRIVIGAPVGAETLDAAEMCSIEDIVRACVAVGADRCDCGAAASLLIATTLPNAARDATRRFAQRRNEHGSGNGNGNGNGNSAEVDQFRALSEAMRCALQIVCDALEENGEGAGASAAPHTWRWSLSPSPTPYASPLRDAAPRSAARHIAPADARRFFSEFSSRLGAIAVGASCNAAVDAARDAVRGTATEGRGAKDDASTLLHAPARFHLDCDYPTFLRVRLLDELLSTLLFAAAALGARHERAGAASALLHCVLSRTLRAMRDSGAVVEHAAAEGNASAADASSLAQIGRARDVMSGEFI